MQDIQVTNAFRTKPTRCTERGGVPEVETFDSNVTLRFYFNPQQPTVAILSPSVVLGGDHIVKKVLVTPSTRAVHVPVNQLFSATQILQTVQIDSSLYCFIFDCMYVAQQARQKWGTMSHIVENRG